MSTDLNGTLDVMLAEAERCQREASLTEAIGAYRRLLASWPGLPTCWYELGRLQRKARDFAGALASYKEALERQIAHPEEVHLNRGVIFSDFLNDYDAAVRELNAALALNPGYLPALINLANLYEDLGRRDHASEVYERMLALQPEAPQILARYAGLKNFRDRDDPFIARMRRALAEPRIDVADRASLGFALGRALDGCGEYDEAYRAYLAANRDSRASAPPGFRDYDLREHEHLIDSLIAAFPCRRDSNGPQIYSPKAGAPQPIFICGMFRSGSTLTEQLLAGHPEVSAGGELHFLRNAVQTRLEPFPEAVPSASTVLLESIAVEYLDMLREIFGETRFVTDKRPDNFLLIGLIKTLFPTAKIIHTTRNALDNCLSIYFLHLDQAMSYALDPMDIGHYYAQYRRLMTHWKTLYGGDILDLNYDALVADPRPVVDRMLEFLGLSPDERCLVVPPAGRVIKTASVWQAREPLYQRSSGRAQHYERQLGALRDYLLAN